MKYGKILFTLSKENLIWCINLIMAKYMKTTVEPSDNEEESLEKNFSQVMKQYLMNHFFMTNIVIIHKYF